jgi:hypothetical protein
MDRSVSGINSVMMDGVKKSLDPNNIFAINNTIYRSEAEKIRDHEFKLKIE